MIENGINGMDKRLEIIMGNTKEKHRGIKQLGKR